ncbi:helix-turn-helix domain-containing protein [Bacteroides timonensis]|uniref:helix-turn-helix domain-containing protein n=1 Tax=Bacteroides timonensis TaxID=1470345 RepID=UPI0004B9DA13|nr:helix-turn-helix transcriptional regulator [Bacteroides timonensis]
MMNPLSVILYSIFLPLCIIGILQFVQRPCNKANRHLGIAMLLVALGVFQNLYFMEPPSTRIHVILLLPLNLTFLPYYFSIRYIEAFSQQELFPKRFVSSIKYLAIGEIGAHLLPIGVILFTGEYSRAILDFLFQIRSICFLAFILFVIAGAVKANANIKNVHTQEGLDRKIYNGIRLFIMMTVVLSILLGISIIIPLMVARVDRLIFYIPQIMIGLYFIGWGGYNLIINQSIATVFAEEYREVRKAENPYYTQLISLLESEKIYRNPNLRISDVAERLSISPNYLSRIINETSDDGFSELVNQYRVAEVIERIRNREYHNKTIISLAMEVGFSSKSTFQSVFKKVTGKTPSEYKAASEKQ